MLISYYTKFDYVNNQWSGELNKPKTGNQTEKFIRYGFFSVSPKALFGISVYCPVYIFTVRKLKNINKLYISSVLYFLILMLYRDILHFLIFFILKRRPHNYFII